MNSKVFFRTLSVSIFAVFAMLLSCAPPKAGSATNSNIAPTVSQAAQQPPPSPAVVAIPDGAALYAEKCAGCHGDHGEGAKKGISLISGHALHHSVEEYIEQVNHGTEKKMPAFKGKLSPEQIAAVVNHVRSTLQSMPVGPAK